MAPTVLVTGAARRIGAAIASRFAREGFHTVLHYGRAQREAETLAAQLCAQGHRAETFALDLSDAKDVERAANAFAQTHPNWSILVNNAAQFELDDAGGPKAEIWQKSAAVNLWAAVELANVFCAARAGQQGAIINILDQKLDNINPDFFSYTLSKDALRAASQMLALQHAPQIRVLNVAPGLTLASSDQTDEEFNTAATLNPLQRQTLPADIAEAVYFAATSSMSSGQTLHIDGGQRLSASPRDVMFAVRGAL